VVAERDMVVPFHLFRPTDNMASPLLEFLLER